MTRSDFQALALIRIEEAGVQLAAGKWDGAYYLAGYAVERGLKACIAKLTSAEDFPPKEVREYYTHDLVRLLKTAGLEALWNAEKGANPTFQQLWTDVESWDEESRYERKPEAEARSLYLAVTDPTNGVLRWIRGHW